MARVKTFRKKNFKSVMKTRTKGFLSEENIDHESEIFDYINELHNIIWHFIRAVEPGASGKMQWYVDAVLNAIRTRFSEVPSGTDNPLGPLFDVETKNTDEVEFKRN